MELKHEKWLKINRVLTIILVAFLLVLVNLVGVIFAKYDNFKKDVIKENKSGSAPYLSSPEKFKATLPQVKDASSSPVDQNALINILILGIGGAGHPGANLTDTFQVLSIDPIKKKMRLISLPRDLYISDPKVGGPYKLNEFYNRGEAKGLGGGAIAKEVASQVLGIPVHYFIRMDFQGFSKLVDEVGGVDINVTKNLYDPQADMKLNLTPGTYHMNGDLALRYSRSRETSSDFDRSARQQQVIMALRQKINQENIINNPQSINHILTILQDHLTTDLQVWEAVKTFNLIKDLKQEDLTQKVIDNNPTDKLLYSTYSNGGAYILLPYDKSYQQIKNYVKTNLP